MIGWKFGNIHLHESDFENLCDGCRIVPYFVCRESGWLSRVSMLVRLAKGLGSFLKSV